MKYIASVFIILLFGFNHPKEEHLFSLKEEVKLMLFTSVLEDGGVYCANYSFDKKMTCFKKVYDNLKISQSKKIKSEFINDKKEIHTFYSLQLFKVDSYIGASCRYLLHYKDVESEAWYRIKGYKENDFIHFYKRVLLKYSKKKRVYGIIKSWCKNEDLFNEVDFACLIEGVKKENNQKDCFISETSSFLNKMTSNASKKQSELQLYDKIYGRFSNRPYSGTLPR